MHLNKLDYKCCTWLLSKIDVKLIESENLNVIIPSPCPCPRPGRDAKLRSGELGWAELGEGGEGVIRLLDQVHATDTGNARTFSLISCLDMCLLSVLRLVYDHNNFVLFCVLFNV